MNGFLKPNEDGLQLLNKIANPSLFTKQFTELRVLLLLLLPS